MSRAAPHPLFPRESAEEHSRHDFYKDLKQLVVAEVKPRIAERYASLQPAFVAAHGREPATADEAGSVVAADPAYRWYSALDSRWRSQTSLARSSASL